MLFVLAAAAAACDHPQSPDAGDQPGTTASDADSLVMVDDLGREVEVAGDVRRVASLSPGFTEALFEMGCGDRVVLRDLRSDYPAGVARIPAVDGLRPDAGRVAASRPDLVLLYAVDHMQARAFGKVGLSAAVLDPGGYDEVVEQIADLGAMVGCGSGASDLAVRMRETRRRVARLAAEHDEPRVYVELDGSDQARPWTIAEGSFVDELLRIAKGRNVVEGLSGGYVQVSAEAVIRADPEVVLLLGEGASAEDFALRTGWSDVTAVREGRVIDGIDADLLVRPGPRLATGLDVLLAAIHGDGLE
ncbi:MAG: ABC transporter substrate-binding protein [Polyangia bacterium]